MIKVNILSNPNFKKPSKEEYKKIQKIICDDENIKELEFKEFAHLVGEKGYIWKSSLLQGGAKNENFKEAHILSLDFDEGITIDNFLNRSKDLGLEPTFIYQTFSHTEENHRFRVVWRLNEVTTNPQLKTALQLMLMEVFPEHDKNCKDLSRLWVGGKRLSFYNEFNTLNLENLLNSLITVISEKEPNQVNRNIKAFCKKVGLNVYNKFPFMLKSVENPEMFYKISNRELRENRQKIDTFLYDNMIFSFDTNSYNDTKATCKGAKIQTIKGEKLKKTKIDWINLYHKCNLFNDFTNGKKLDHNEIFHLSTNLYEFEKYPTILKELLNKYNYNNWENKYNTYAVSVNNAYAPTRCENSCKYYNECMNPLNIKEKYYQKESKVKKIYDEPTITLDEAEKQLKEIPSMLEKMTKNDILFLRAVTGIGKTELLKVLSLKNVIIAVPSHKLGQETFNRLSEINPDLLYIKPLKMDNLPPELKNTIQKYYDLGIPGEVKKLAFDEIKRLNKLGLQGEKHPDYYYDLKEYIDQLDKIPEADTMLFTHHRISYGNTNNNIDTIILDEDFLKSFIKYDDMDLGETFNDIRKLMKWVEKYSKGKYQQEYIELEYNLKYMFSNEVGESIQNHQWFKNRLRSMILDEKFIMMIKNYIKENKEDFNTNLFKLFRAERVVVKGDRIHIANGEAIKELSNYKVVVMSATIDEEIHIPYVEKYLPEKNIIFKDIANTELKGEIICDCSYTWSREGLKNITEKASKKLEKILDDDRYNNIITFKNNELIDVEKHGKRKITHFGATEGIDEYKNQNLCIIGTPHNNSTLYEAYGVLLTGKSPVSNTWKVKRVQKYGFEFDLNTYENEEDEIFTRIQLYFLYSELIQAVGRARALRFDAKVFVHSALPLPNSTLI